MFWSNKEYLEDLEVCVNTFQSHIEDGECQSCRKLKDEVTRLKDKYESKVKDENLPEYLWNVFPATGSYLKNILKFCGYVTVNSVLKLKHQDELEKAFTFTKSMVDLIDNKEEVLGIFHRFPEKLMMMPGLEVGWFKEPNAGHLILIFNDPYVDLCS